MYPVTVAMYLKNAVNGHYSARLKYIVYAVDLFIRQNIVPVPKTSFGGIACRAFLSGHISLSPLEWCAPFSQPCFAI